MGVIRLVGKLKDSYRNAKPLNYEPLKTYMCGEETKHNAQFRAKIPGGWLVQGSSDCIAFVPDPDHRWDGGSIE